MSSRLTKVVHIEVKDYENAMVGAKTTPDFSYTCQKEYYYKKKKIKEDKYDSISKKLLLPEASNKRLRKEVKKLMSKPFSFLDDENNVNVVIKGGSTIDYSGNKKAKFMRKVLNLEEVD